MDPVDRIAVRMRQIGASTVEFTAGPHDGRGAQSRRAGHVVALIGSTEHLAEDLRGDQAIADHIAASSLRHRWTGVVHAIGVVALVLTAALSADVLILQRAGAVG